MGDHRAIVKIEMEFHGIKDKCDMWINYWPSNVEGVDDRIIEFCRRIYEKGMAKYENEMAERLEKEYEQEIRQAEEKEFARLKAKLGH